MSQDYNQTLNLLKTDFPMRAGLPQREPEMLKKWYDESRYERLMEKNEGKPLFVLHDGPPYANGDIHLGTALNKILKDFIVRYKNMSGFKAPYVPGWDTHGLPTELKARAKAGIDANSTISDVELRSMCRDFTLGYLDDQREQFKRLGGIGEWNNPYITLTPDFEKMQLEIFATMANKGYIYKGLKPVYWCAECQTALAEAEIEYAEDPCDSIYVKFNVTDDKGKLSAMGADLSKTYFVIWTTTTWTLPGNVAICVGPDFTYVLVKANGEYYVLAKELAEKVMAINEYEYEIVGEIAGSELEYMTAQHPFLDRKSLVIVGDHVTLDAGTGCVHTAPGHGVEDFDVSKKYSELEIVVPVDDRGFLTAEAGMFKGLKTDVASKVIKKHLVEIGALYASEKIVHQYPHCWRCKQPIIYRATSQWFCSIDNFKQQALEEAQKVQWLPDWGKERIRSMIAERKDWCISRQRKWGVPIPVFYCADCGKEIVDYDVMMRISKLFGEHGSDVWFSKDAKELLPEDFKCPHCSSNREFYKEKDIMDVWFDSGSSHTAVCAQRPYLKYPVDVYLEGADQFRGWFQSSLLTSVAYKGIAPYKTVISHGWVVDGEGRKMSKSLGNGIVPSEIVEKYGADILRLWVASSDYHADIRISNDILKQLSEVYRKIRNTARFMLGNLNDFEPDRDSVCADKLLDIDRFALMRLDALVSKCIEAYENYEYHIIFHAIHNFCVVDMSNFYLDVIKDRLYIEPENSETRRAAQMVMHKILRSLTLLVSPILAFTSEEIWGYMPHSSTDNVESVLFNDIPSDMVIGKDDELVARWDRLHQVRDDVKKALEIARASKIIGSSLDAKVTLFADGELYDFLKANENALSVIFITSGAKVEKGEGEFKGVVEGLSISVATADGGKCERCWSYSTEVGSDSDHPTLCPRCAKIIKENF
ncbi:MAG: isoleucine--tRNA ligase [Clostridia bacterium]|nr:isoleucine--tRNA ligase [Clostridia bacterium]